MTNTLSVGIDLGTIYSECFFFNVSTGNTQPIVFDNGNQFILSSVFFGQTPVLVGGDNTLAVYEAKRLLGVKFTDSSVQKMIETMPNVEQDASTGLCVFKIVYNGKTITLKPEEISAMVLTQIKKSIIKRTGCDLSKCRLNVVLTCPAYFNDLQRDLTMRAAQIAGLDVTLTAEPKAAAYFYGVKKMKDGLFFAFDFGGGTLDTTVFEKKGKNIKFIGVYGNQHLGGLDIDNKFVEYIISKWKAEFPTEMANLFIEQKNETISRKNMKRRRRRVLKQIVEKAKISLSTLNCVTVEYEEYSIAVTRKDFEMCCSDIFNECMKTVKDTLNLEKVQANPRQISKVILVGGSSQIPKIRNMLTDYFGEGKVCCSENCYTVVAEGACQYAYDEVSSGIKIAINEVTTRDIKMMAVDGNGTEFWPVVVERGTPLPLEEYSFPAIAETSSVRVELKEDETFLGCFDTQVPLMRNEVVTIKIGIDNNGKIQLNLINKAGVSDAKSVLANVSREKNIPQNILMEEQKKIASFFN